MAVFYNGDELQEHEVDASLNKNGCVQKQNWTSSILRDSGHYLAFCEASDDDSNFRSASVNLAIPRIALNRPLN